MTLSVGKIPCKEVVYVEDDLGGILRITKSSNSIYSMVTIKMTFPWQKKKNENRHIAPNYKLYKIWRLFDIFL